MVLVIQDLLCVWDDEQEHFGFWRGDQGVLMLLEMLLRNDSINVDKKSVQNTEMEQHLCVRLRGEDPR